MGETMDGTVINRRLFVGGLFPEVTKDELHQRFAPFGHINSVEIKIRKDYDGTPIKTFAYIDLKTNDVDLKKLMSSYNRTKWKGSELKLQQAKENFLLRLEKERKEQKELSSVENVPKERKSKTSSTVVQNKLLDIAGTENAVNMKPSGAKPGTLVPGKKDWIVGKYGRVLPIVQLKKSGISKLMKVDPSKYTHTVRRIKETDDMPKTTGGLTWQLEDKDNAVTKKRKGEFPEWKSEKKRCSNFDEIRSKLKEIISRNKMVGDDIEMEVVPVAAIRDKTDSSANNKLKNQQMTCKPSIAKFDSDSESDADTSKCNNTVAAQLDLSRFDSDSDNEETSPSKALSPNKIVGNESKDKSKGAASRIKTEGKSDKVLLTNSVIPNNNPVPKLIEGKKKLKAFGGTKSLLSTVTPVIQPPKIVDLDSVIDIANKKAKTSVDKQNQGNTFGKVYISSDEEDVQEVCGTGASNNISQRQKLNFSASKSFALQYSFMDEYGSGIAEASSKSEMNRMSDEDDDSDFESFVKKETLKIQTRGNNIRPDVKKLDPFLKESNHDNGIVTNPSSRINSLSTLTGGARTKFVPEKNTEHFSIKQNEQTNNSNSENVSMEVEDYNDVKIVDRILNDSNLVDFDSDDSESESDTESSDKSDENDNAKTLSNTVGDNEVVDDADSGAESDTDDDDSESDTDDENIADIEDNSSVKNVDGDNKDADDGGDSESDTDDDDSESDTDDENIADSKDIGSVKNVVNDNAVADDGGDDSESDTDDDDVGIEKDDNSSIECDNGESDDNSDFEKLISEAVSVVKRSDETIDNAVKKNTNDVLTNVMLGNPHAGNEACLVKKVTNDCVINENKNNKVEMKNTIITSDEPPNSVHIDSEESECDTDSESEDVEKEDEKENAIELEDTSESENSDSESNEDEPGKVKGYNGSDKDEKQIKMDCADESDSEESDTDSDDCKIDDKQPNSNASGKSIVSPVPQVKVSDEHKDRRPNEKQGDNLSRANQTKKLSFGGAKNSRTVSGQAESKGDIDRKRLEAVKLRQKENMAQKSLIQTALANLDAGKPANKKIVFDSDDDGDVAMDTSQIEPDQESTETLSKLGFETGTKGKSLFDSSDDDDESADEDRFKIRQEFEGSSGKQLAILQSKYGNDERFKLDARFIESGSDEDEPEIEIEDETQRSLKILQSVVGVKAMRGVSKMEKAKKKFKDIGTLKYDPTKEEHQQQFEIKTVVKQQPEEIKTKKKKKKKDKLVEEEAPEIVVPEVSKEKFFEVSDSLKNTFIEKAQTESQSEAQTGTGFSLLSMFGNNQSDGVSQNEAQTGGGFSLLSMYGTHQSDDDADNNDNAAAIPIPAALRTNQMSLDNRFKVMDDTDDDDDDDDDGRVDNTSSTDKSRSAESETASGTPVQPVNKVNKPSTFFFLPDDLRLKDSAQKPDSEMDRKTWMEKRRHLTDCYKSKYRNYKRKHRDGNQRGGNPRQRGGRRR